MTKHSDLSTRARNKGRSSRLFLPVVKKTCPGFVHGTRSRSCWTCTATSRGNLQEQKLHEMQGGNRLQQKLWVWCISCCSCIRGEGGGCNYSFHFETKSSCCECPHYLSLPNSSCSATDTYAFYLSGTQRQPALLHQRARYSENLGLSGFFEADTRAIAARVRLWLAHAYFIHACRHAQFTVMVMKAWVYALSEPRSNPRPKDHSHNKPHTQGEEYESVAEADLMISRDSEGCIGM